MGQMREYKGGHARVQRGVRIKVGWNEKVMCTRRRHCGSHTLLHWQHRNTVKIVTVAQYSVSDRIVDRKKRFTEGFIQTVRVRTRSECVLRIQDLPEPQTRTVSLVVTFGLNVRLDLSREATTESLRTLGT